MTITYAGTSENDAKLLDTHHTRRHGSVDDISHGAHNSAIAYVLNDIRLRTRHIGVLHRSLRTGIAFNEESAMTQNFDAYQSTSLVKTQNDFDDGKLSSSSFS